MAKSRWPSALYQLQKRALGMRDASLYIMLSSGGTATVETARRFPIRLIESGPAAGALAAAEYGAGPDDSFAFGLRAVLDGLHARLTATAADC